MTADEFVELRMPVSAKGIVVHNGAVLLVSNDRDEWELPGGKLELHETPEICVAREIFEESNLRVRVESPVHAWVYTIFEGRHVFVVAYGCRLESDVADMESTEEHQPAFHAADSLDTLSMPDDYKRAIASWLEANQSKPKTY